MAQEVVKVKKGSFFGKLLLFILAFIIGAIASLGGVAGVLYYVAKKKTLKELFGYTPYNYSSFISEEYAQKTVWDAVGSALSEAKKLADGSLTLRDLEDISPRATNKVLGYVDSLYSSYGIALNQDGELMDVPLSSLKSHFNACIEETPVINIISAFGESNDILDALCYGIEGEDYIVNADGSYQMLEGHTPLTIKEFAGEDLNDRIERLPITSFMDVDPDDEIMRSLAYGPAHRYEIVTENDEKRVELNFAYYTLDVDVFYDDNGNELQCTAETLANGDYVLTLQNGTKQYVSKNEQGTYHVFKALESEQGYEKGEQIKFKTTTVGQLQDESEELINAVSLKEALGVDHTSHAVLIALACGQEGVDFEYATDEFGNKTGITMLNDGRTIGDLRNDSQTLIDEIYLSALIEMDPHDTIVMYLHYGKKNVHYQVNLDDTINPLQKKAVVIDGKICNEYGEELENVDIVYLNSDIAKFTQTVNGETYTYYMDKNNFVEEEKRELWLHGGVYEFYHVYDKDGSAIYYTASQIKDLTTDNALFNNLTGRLSLDDIIEIEDNRILSHMHDVVIDDLSDEINNLTIGEVFETDIYYTNSEGQFTSPDGTVVPSEERVMRPMWKYMLTPTDESEPNLDYKITSDLNTMIQNVQDNVRTKTLLELVEDGIIEPEDTSAFTKIIPDLPEYGEYAGKCIGNFNIEELVQFLSILTIGWEAVS